MGVEHSWIGRVLRIHFSGVLRASDLATHSRYIYQGDRLDRMCGLLADFTDVTTVSVVPEDVMEFAGMGRDILEIRGVTRQGVPLAIVSTNPDILRLLHIHIASHIHGVYHPRTFADLASAEAWIVRETGKADDNAE